MSLTLHERYDDTKETQYTTHHTTPPISSHLISPQALDLLIAASISVSSVAHTDLKADLSPSSDFRGARWWVIASRRHATLPPQDTHTLQSSPFVLGLCSRSGTATIRYDRVSQSHSISSRPTIWPSRRRCALLDCREIVTCVEMARCCYHHHLALPCVLNATYVWCLRLVTV
jgi:hypothetical protein